MPLRFTASLVGRIVRSYLLITALICGIYLVEQFVPLLENAMRYAFGGLVFGKLLLMLTPGIIDFALPLAVLSVAYFVVLDARERRELLAISAAGSGATHLVVVVVATGALAAGVSLAISGFVKPAASFAFRTTFAASLNETLSKGAPVGAFYAQRDRVLYSRPSSAPDQRVFRLFEFEGDRLQQVVVSDCARMRVERGVVMTETCDVKGYRFGGGNSAKAVVLAQAVDKKPCSVCADPEGHVTLARFSAGESTFSFAMGDVFTAPARDRSMELSLVELLAGDGDRFGNAGNAELATAKILSALSCVMAVFMALLAVAFTTPRTRAIALPLAGAAMMGAMILVNSQAWLLQPDAGRLMLLVKLAAVAGGLLLVVTLVTRSAYGRLVAPALARP
jgi:lipopolysaccharide export LptBFGC system permease protein LptF